MIYPELNSKIQTILESISKIKSIYAYPATKLDSYPSAIYFPSTIQNTFNNTADNFKVYGYKLYLVVNAENTTVQQIFSSAMPKLVDAVLKKLDDEWSFDSIDGHRVWCSVETGDWLTTDGQAGIEISAEINLSVRMLTT
ncbi:MAG: hypothetical protein ACTSUF_07705 [Candidatus Heimdallarchaeaceae archaeon]